MTTSDDVYAAIQEIQATTARRPRGVRLTPAEQTLLLRELPPATVDQICGLPTAFFGVDVDVVDPIIIATNGRWIV